ncbi:MAG: ABC transporter permease [Acidobacteria bacterium]|jgi:lipoprotein-releasing system permease protein|nr:MAG: ABC transporter permease [Acidobacteriota bacterium]
MRLLFNIALRYLLSSKGSTLLVSLIALCGVALSVVAVLLTMGVFAGFQKALKEKILSSSPHIIVSLLNPQEENSHNLLSFQRDIERIYFVVLYQGLLSKEGKLSSVSVRGMKVRDIKDNYAVRVEEGVALGAGLADIMGVKVGDEVVLLSPMGIKTPFGFIPKAQSFKVEGVFQKGVFDQDYATVIMRRERAEELFGNTYQVVGYEVYLKDPYKAQEVRSSMEKSLGYSAIVRSWIDLNKPLFNALQLEKVGIFFVLLLMVLIASFNITSLLFMKVKEKTKDIAILRTYGLKRGGVLLIFLLQGTILGLTGTLLGLFLSLIGGYLINTYKLVRVPADVYLMDHIPVHFETGDLIFTLVGALLLSLLAGLLPAYKASKESIVRVLRNE